MMPHRHAPPNKLELQLKYRKTSWKINGEVAGENPDTRGRKVETTETGRRGGTAKTLVGAHRQQLKSRRDHSWVGGATENSEI